MTKNISLTAAKIKAARVASIYRISCLVIVAVLVVPTLSVFGQGLTLDDYRALKGTQPVLAKGFQQNRVYHTNGTLWNSWDNLGNTGDISCSAVVPGFTYPGGTVLNYLCRGGYWIVAKSNTANGLVNAAGEASTYLEGTTGEYVLTRGTIAGDVSEGWATEMDPANFPPNDYSQEPWISKVEWHTAAGLKVVATRYSWSFPGKTNNYFLIGSPTEYFDFNDFIIDDITLTYDGDLDGDGVPDANAVATLDQVTLGVKADHDCVWNIGPAGFLENFWDDDGVDYDEETFTTFEFDGDRTTTSEDDTGIDDPLREWRGIHIGRTWIESPDVQLFANGSLMTFPGNTISHYWWTGENDPQNAAKRFAFTTAVFNSENEALSTDFTFDPTLSGDLKTQNPPVTDMRYMQAYGPWVMNKGESVTVVTAILAGAGLENAKNASRAARQAYNWGYNLPKPPPAPMMRHDQIEVTADLTVRVYWENPNEGAIDPDLGRADFAGYRVYRSQISPQSESREILEREGAGLPSNIAESKSFAGDTGGPYRVIKEIPKSDLSTYVSGNGYSYEDADVILGFDYWYYVAAYDDGDPTMTNWQGTPLPNGLPSLESYRTMNYPLDPELGIPTSPRKITVAADAVTSAKFEDKDPPVIPVPNPWRPGGPKSTVVFTGLPADATIKIFDVSGNLVQTIEHQSSISSAEWDLLSRSRTQVVAGIYYYRVEDNTNGKVQFGKLMVIR